MSDKIYSTDANQSRYPFILQDLPFSLEDFNSGFSQETFDYHYKKHHATYVQNLNSFMKNDTSFHNHTLEQIMFKSYESQNMQYFNNAAQIWNHSFFWQSIKPNGGGRAPEKIASIIKDSFGSYDAFVEEFISTSLKQFGSGWSWLVFADKKFRIIKTSNAEFPMLFNNEVFPILTCDVWEHAYYIDYRNRRRDYVESYIKNMINWEFAANQIKARST